MIVAKPDPCGLHTVAVAYVGEVQAALQQGSPDASLLQACTVDVAVAHLKSRPARYSMLQSLPTMHAHPQQALVLLLQPGDAALLS